MLYKIFVRPILFLLDPEKAHTFVLSLASRFTFLYPMLKYIYSPGNNTAVNIDKIKFRNSLGLAAGFDKNGIAIRFWDALGFSHVEVGTVTPLPQPGNSKPRVFRLEKAGAIINRLGFNNEGSDKIKENIEKARKYVSNDFIIGVNLGKNRDTPLENTFSDIKKSFEKLFDVADYFTLNISSPNTEGLRKLHEPEYLKDFLGGIQKLNRDISKLKSSSLKCIFLKISPDLSDDAIKSVYHSVVNNNINGIIATNTTIERFNLKGVADESGGLSGKPLKGKADKVLQKLSELNKNNKAGSIVLIGVGGVFSVKDFEDKISLGATLVQVYTGFIYEGPAIIKKILT